MADIAEQGVAFGSMTLEQYRLTRAKPPTTSRVRTALLIAAGVALILFSGGILWSSGMLDGIIHRCSVETANGQCLDDLASKLTR